MSVAIRIENVSKLYRLGTVGTGTIAHDLNRWWHAVRGKEDPYAKVGQVNDRTKTSASHEKRDTSSDSSPTPLPLASRPSPLSSSSPLVPRPSLLRDSGPDYVWALRDINLEVQQGEILGIIGRNGAGKSTLLKLLSRVTAPTTGCIKTKGRIASLLEVGTGFHPEMTGRENIYMNGAILGMRRHEITRHLEQIVEFSGCAKYLDTPVKRYSSGMTVRLAFAVAAHLECQILIIDEVLAVGDVDFQLKCLKKMESISGSGRTVLFVSHQLAAVQAICRQTAIVDKGCISFLGPSTAALEKYATMSSEWRLSNTSKGATTRTGTGLARLSQLILRSDTGEHINSIPTGHSVTLEFQIDLNDDVTDADVADIGFGIHTLNTDDCLCVDWSSFWGHAIPLTANQRQLSVKCNIEQLQLQPGSYVIKTCIKISGIVADHIPAGSTEFQVVLGEFYGTGCTGYSGHAPLMLRNQWARLDLLSATKCSFSDLADVPN